MNNPEMEPRDEIIGTLAENIRQLELIKDEILDTGLRIMKAGNGNVLSADLFILGGIKKALSTTRGFITVLQDDNYICAATLIRIQLDSALRLFALTLVEDRNKFVEAIIDGAYLSSLKDRDGKPMTDSYLHKALNIHYSWVSDAYDHASGFVHLSNKHINSIITNRDDDERTLSILISEKDALISDEDKSEAALVMCAVNRIVLAVCKPWVVYKEGLEVNGL